ncbi:hypothetical protein MK514_05125 [Streptococcus gordonii]|uniref:hypothetical protein n=1 Tax=Streptococcus gordonii TaxID=1302 RepID=UPI001E4BB7B2|nr:hypothetical protein [Streptococcus gordonii]MCY7130356.1 hypothetical protein [Streptococcus gordonii]MCY7141024.1 hypothetical protein [Streptococcus gordonii]
MEEVYNCYGDILPEEELLSLDLIERILGLIRTGTGSFAEDIFDDYFKQVKLLMEVCVLQFAIQLQMLSVLRCRM